MRAEPTSPLNQMGTPELWKFAALCTLVSAALLGASFKAAGQLDWPVWLVWVGRDVAAGFVAVLWHSTAWQMLREIRQRNCRVPATEPDSAHDNGSGRS